MNAILCLLVALVARQSLLTVTGTVMDNETRQAIVDARVLLAPIGELTDSVTARTDESGHFVFPRVRPGTYRIFAMREDYLRQEYATPLNVAPGQPTASVLIGLVPTGVIAGRVLSELGDPASRVLVRARTAGRIAAEARTNDLGDYRMFGLAPGSYVVSAERFAAPRIDADGRTAGGRGAGPRYITPTPPCPDCPGEGMGMMSLATILRDGLFMDSRALSEQTSPPVYYDGTTDQRNARPVQIAPGARLYGIDFQLIAVTQGR